MQIERMRLITAAQAAQASMAENKVPGLAMAFFSGGEQVCAETLGIADSVRNLPVSMGTHFEAASLTKPVFAYLVLRLVEAGVLRLDAPLCESLPGSLPTEDPRFAQATAAHVLSHGTGLPNWGAAPLPLAFAPGQGFRYSGTGYACLQTVVEHRTGRRLDDLLQTELFGPLGMEDAAIADYPKFLAQILSETGFASRVRAVRNPAGHGVEWGLGWGLYQEVLWHWGDNGGFKSFVCFDPVTRDALLIHTNGANGLHTCFDVAEHCTGFDFSNIAAMIAEAE